MIFEHFTPKAQLEFSLHQIYRTRGEVWNEDEDEPDDLLFENLINKPDYYYRR